MEISIEEIIIKALAAHGVVAGDSGFCFTTGTRDVTFHDDNDNAVEITIRALKTELERNEQQH